MVLTNCTFKLMLTEEVFKNSFLDMISQNSDTRYLQWSHVCDF